MKLTKVNGIRHGIKWYDYSIGKTVVCVERKKSVQIVRLIFYGKKGNSFIMDFQMEEFHEFVNELKKASDFLKKGGEEENKAS